MDKLKIKQAQLIDSPAPSLLSVVVSCKAVKEILSQHLHFLQRQDLSQELWQAVFIFREDSGFQPALSLIKKYFSSPQFLFLKVNQPLYEMRNLAFDHLDSPYLYFIDEDVILEKADHLSRLLKLHKKHSDVSVLGGAYLNHPASTFWGNCYNWLVRLWLKAHKTDNNQDVVPAGNLSVKGYKNFKARFYSPQGFGAEELYFFKSLHQEGRFSYLDTSLDSPHLARHSFKDFVQRAWLHGKSAPQQKMGDKRLFFKESGGFLTKITALFYLLLVRFSLIWRRFRLLFQKWLDF